MRAEVRECLKEAWGVSVGMLEAGECASEAGRLATGSYSGGIRFVVRSFWAAHGFEGAPCRHCWRPKVGMNHKDYGACGKYEPVEGWG